MEVIKNKYIKFLIVINAVLLPIVLIIFLYHFLPDVFGRGYNSDVYYNEPVVEKKTEFVIRNTKPKKILNSDTYFVAIYKLEFRGYTLYDDDESKAIIPKGTSNLIFLDSNLAVKKVLFDDKMVINCLIMPFKNSLGTITNQNLKQIVYLVVEDDSNSDGTIDTEDNSYLYTSDLEGNNLTKLLEKPVTSIKLSSDSNRLIITYKGAFTNRYGVYNLKSKTYNDADELNEILKKNAN